MKYNYDHRSARHEDTRNYKQEAQDLIKGLSNSQLYTLYEIVVNKLKRSNSETRDKELNAVQAVIEKVYGIDRDRLRSVYQGYKSSMAAEATPASGYNPLLRKKKG